MVSEGQSIIAGTSLNEGPNPRCKQIHTKNVSQKFVLCMYLSVTEDKREVPAERFLVRLNCIIFLASQLFVFYAQLCLPVIVQFFSLK